MIKRSPQEIADIFQCYVAMDRNGEWNIYENRPAIKNGMSFWVADSGFDAEINKVLLEVPADHDWTHLYEPRPCSEKPADSINKEASCSEKALVSENKPAHLEEVYTHKEYCVESHTALTPLMSRITAMMNNGWKPQGGIFKDWDENCDGGEYRYYQAMARGV